MNAFPESNPGTIDSVLSDTAKMLRATFTKTSLLFYKDKVRPDFLFCPKKTKEEENYHENKFVPLGIVLEDVKCKKSFMYTSLYSLNQKARVLALGEFNPVQIYFHLSFEAFAEAEKLYQRTKSLDSVYKFLAPKKKTEKSRWYECQ
jgi:hypothetical protein